MYVRKHYNQTPIIYHSNDYIFVTGNVPSKEAHASYEAKENNITRYTTGKTCLPNKYIVESGDAYSDREARESKLILTMRLDKNLDHDFNMIYDVYVCNVEFYLRMDSVNWGGSARVDAHDSQGATR
ncbi:hypothetical protein DPMN_048882 [Dreissena polymorpha]|uniref:Uncharacterized protein n=1 Tax=Dreissena polymorpha TaxID=45954 RepID=A0A9D4I3B3_DREPO|nr:hypothetical protein DPMN_048882 [Dreissena polymorpha]